MEAFQREIEAKFALADREIFEELRTVAMVGGLEAGPEQTKVVTDRYLDTSSRLILAAGYACRLRETARTRTLALKSLGATIEVVKERLEYQVELERACPVEHYLEMAHWPAGPIRTLVQAAGGQNRLMTLLVLQQTRYVRTLTKGGRPVALLSLDQVRGIHPEPCYDLELELAPQASPADLEKLVTMVAREWRLTPAVLSKFERELGRVEAWDGRLLTHLSAGERAALARAAEFAPPLPAHVAYLLLLWDAGLAPRTIGIILGLTKQRVLYWLRVFESRRTTLFAPRPAALRPKAPEMTPGDLMSEAGRATLRLHFWRMLDHEPGTRLGVDIEELHDMRVATRRMRAALEVFGPYFQANVVEPYQKGLRRTGRALGPVRDLDVFEEKARAYLGTLPPEQRGGLDALLEAWHDERVAARETMLVYLDGNGYARFVARFAKFLTSPGRGAAALAEGMPRVRDVVPQLIMTRFKTVLVDGQNALAAGTIAELHALRIDCKKLRYALEFFTPVLGPEAGSVIEEIKRLQDHLGDLNDAHLAAGLLRAFQDERPGAQDGIAAYLASRVAEQDRLMRAFPAAWASLSALARVLQDLSGHFALFSQPRRPHVDQQLRDAVPQIEEYLVYRPAGVDQRAVVLGRDRVDLANQARLVLDPRVVGVVQPQEIHPGFPVIKAACANHPWQQVLSGRPQVEDSIGDEGKTEHRLDPRLFDTSDNSPGDHRVDIPVGQTDHPSAQSGDDLLLDAIGKVGGVKEVQGQIAHRVAQLGLADSLAS
jgi:CHAD domain-containing protein